MRYSDCSGRDGQSSIEPDRVIQNYEGDIIVSEKLQFYGSGNHRWLFWDDFLRLNPKEFDYNELKDILEK
jgi:hypothetical protein